MTMIVTNGLSPYTKGYPLTKTRDRERVLKDEGWVQCYICPKIIHSNNGVRFTSPTGWYKSVFESPGTEAQFGTPYLRMKHPPCERQIDAFKTVMMILMHHGEAQPG